MTHFLDKNAAFIFRHLSLIFYAEGICTKYLQESCYLPTRRHFPEHNFRSDQRQTSRYYASTWLMLLDAGVSQRRPGFNSVPAYMMENKALGQIFSNYFGFPLSVSFHRCSMLIHPPAADAMSHQMTVSLYNTKNYANDHSLIIC